MKEKNNGKNKNHSCSLVIVWKKKNPQINTYLKGRTTYIWLNFWKWNISQQVESNEKRPCSYGFNYRREYCCISSFSMRGPFFVLFYLFVYYHSKMKTLIKSTQIEGKKIAENESGPYKHCSFEHENHIVN